MNKNPSLKTRKYVRKLRGKETDTVASEIEQIPKPKYADPKYEMSKKYSLKECYDKLSHGEIYEYSDDEYTNMYEN